MFKPRSLAELGFRISEEYSEPKQAEHVARMVKELQAIPRQKIPPTTTQEPSTVALLAAQALRDPKDDAAYIEAKWNAPLPASAIAVPGATNEREAVGGRELGPEEILLVEDTRRKSKNTVGQTAESSVTDESKAKAIQAFTYSKPADLNKEDMERIVKMIGIESAPVPYEEPKPSFLKKLGILNALSFIGLYGAINEEDAKRIKILRDNYKDRND